MIRAKVIGASGYGGVGITEFLIGHPQVKLECLVAMESQGTQISAMYPHLKGFCDLPIVAPDHPSAQVPFDVVFMATPDGVGMQYAAAELGRGAKVIDYSGDFRFNTPEAYAEYATRIGKNPTHAAPQLLPEAVYGIAELHRKELTPKTRLVGNPGCFAVSCILGLAPAVKHGLVRRDSIICDCKTGVSGAGKKPSATFHYPARYEQMNAYKLAGHQHVCEVTRELSLLAGAPVKLTFTAQVVPLCRGILSTLYADLLSPMTEADLLAIYRETYRDDVFIRVFESTAGIGTLHVRGTNYCNLTVSVDEPNRRLRIVSHIDNLVKGQAGSACQNMNLICGFDEKAGLDRAGIFP